jgi:carboxyl-terminal processing protease
VRTLLTPRRAAGALLAATLIALPAHAQSGVALDERDIQSLHLFFESLEKIQDYYVEDLSTEELVQLAIDGIVEGLDEHSRFLEPDAFSSMRSKTRGSFSGIGVVVAQRGGTPTVISPIDGTPAARAGVRAGDRLVAIGETSTRDATLDAVVALLRGELGSTVRITVERSGASDPIAFVLTREEIAVDSVIGPIYPRPDVAYIRVARFSESTGSDFARALEAADLAGASALVLDLRDNPGGLLSQGVDVAERFVPAGETIVEVRSRSQIDSRVYRSGISRKWEKPVAVLIDGGTASAAEIVAGAIRDHRVGTLVGERTFGKGSVQSIFAFEGGNALKLTTALYFTPAGTSVEPHGEHGGGIEPDLAVDASPLDSLVTELTLEGIPTAFLAEGASERIDFSIPLQAETIAGFRAFAAARYQVELTGVDDATLDRCLRAELALRDGGQAAVLELRLPDDPQFRRAATVVTGDGSPAVASAGTSAGDAQ